VRLRDLVYGVLGLAAVHTNLAAQADPPAAIEVATACGTERSAASEVAFDDALNAVARELSYDGELDDAIEHVGYPAAKSKSLYLRGPTGDTLIREIIADVYCVGVRDEGFTEVGAYHFYNETWIVLAARAELPKPEDAAIIEARVLELVNAARAESRRCGDRELVAAPPLTLSHELTEAASRHAHDMALHGSFDHLGSDGSQPAERVTEAHYRWRSTGENIAAGQRNAEAVVTAWLDSPEHCENIMGTQFGEMGVAYGLAPSQRPEIYWTQVFGTQL